MNKAWTKYGCTGWQEIDVTDEIKSLLNQIGAVGEHTFSLVVTDGIIRLDEYSDSGGATLFALPQMEQCPACGVKYP